MNILIPHQNHSSTQHLKYALRSIAQYLPDATVTLIGDKPIWTKDVGHISALDEIGLQWKERNIYRKIMHACGVFDKFLVMNDDHYILSDKIIRGRKTPGNYKGHYDKTMKNTFALVGSDKDHDVHLPFNITSDKFAKLADIDWNKPYGYGIQTLYCELNGIKSRLIDDIKINTVMRAMEIRELIAGRTAFSSGDIAWQGEIRSVLVGLFPDKCKYEA